MLPHLVGYCMESLVHESLGFLHHYHQPTKTQRSKKKKETEGRLYMKDLNKKY